MPMAMTLTGLRGTITELNVAVALSSARAAAGLEAGARVIQAKARQNMSSHHYRGRAEAATTVSPPVITPGWVDVKVGIQKGTWAPEGRTFEFGWHSKKGKQPPVKPLAEWALSRGIVGTEREAKSFGFVVARSMKKRGYSFGEFHWLEDAGRDSIPAVVAAVRTASTL
jgi:hypothetical protein